MKVKNILTKTSVSCEHSNSSSFHFIRFGHVWIFLSPGFYSLVDCLLSEFFAWRFVLYALQGFFHVPKSLCSLAVMFYWVSLHSVQKLL